MSENTWGLYLRVRARWAMVATSSGRPKRRARGPTAHPRSCLPLLPSGPDGVHKLGLRWAWPRKIGGDERIRTADPLVANEVLSQLSYIPTKIEGLARAANGSAHASNRARAY